MTKKEKKIYKKAIGSLKGCKRVFQIDGNCGLYIRNAENSINEIKKLIS